MIAQPVTPPIDAPTGKIIEVIKQSDHDDFGYFLEQDPELQMAYTACIRAAGIEWTDEEVAEAVFHKLYGDKVDDLMQYWRQQQALLNVADPEHARAAAVHIAVMKMNRRSKQERSRV